MVTLAEHVFFHVTRFIIGKTKGELLLNGDAPVAGIHPVLPISCVHGIARVRFCMAAA